MNSDEPVRVDECPRDGQSVEWHNWADPGSAGRTNGEFVGCWFGVRHLVADVHEWRNTAYAARGHYEQSDERLTEARAERDRLAAENDRLSAEVAALRAERDRLADWPALVPEIAATVDVATIVAQGGCDAEALVGHVLRAFVAALAADSPEPATDDATDDDDWGHQHGSGITCPVAGCWAARPQWERDPACVEQWPECEEDAYNPQCCRWPKSCSCLRPVPSVAPEEQR